MKAVFVVYNQAYNEEIVEVLESLGQRGFTRWEDVGGRGSETGEPHFGNHPWPVLNHAVLSFVEDALVPELLELLHKKDAETPKLGLRAFVWNVDASI